VRLSDRASKRKIFIASAACKAADSETRYETKHELHVSD
jgi:hypothetical protein